MMVRRDDEWTLGDERRGGVVRGVLITASFTGLLSSVHPVINIIVVVVPILLGRVSFTKQRISFS